MKKRTVCLALDGALYAKAKARGTNASRADETALAQALALRLTQKVKAEIEQDLAAYNAYVEKYGSPAEMLRDYLAGRDDAA